MQVLPAAFQALAAYSQFIVYVLTPSKSRPEKFEKIPIDFRTGYAANAHDSAVQTTAETAIAAAIRLGKNHGVGFVFTKKDPFWFLDIDDCLESCGMKWSPLAIELLTHFAGAAVEISQSNRGLHIISSGVAPLHTCKNSEFHLEFYTQDRFVALTGVQATGNAGLDFTTKLPELINKYFTANTTQIIKAEWTTEPVDLEFGIAEDARLLELALKSQSLSAKFGNNKANFRDLWENNIDVLAQYYPHTAKSYDASIADMALAQHLAFWTANNCERMKTLMLQSHLVREKWQREDYLNRTILTACSRTQKWATEARIAAEVTQVQSIIPHSNDQSITVEARNSGYGFMSAEAQLQHFQGCVYIQDENRIMIPNGEVIDAARFKVRYGGHNFVLAHNNEKIVRNAWEAFTESQILKWPIVDSSYFNPQDAPQAITLENGRRLINTYRPQLDVKRKAGNPELFLLHLKKLFPVEDERLIILSFMCAIVQYQGIKFHWAPVIQGVEGNGKSLLLEIVANAVGRQYSHSPKASEIDAKFNAWLNRKIFIGVDDMYMSKRRVAILETLKNMITKDYQEIEPKGQDKISRKICCNFMFNTNHKDGLAKTENDRRFAIFFTPQQMVRDLKRDGLTSEYFDRLTTWLYLQDGFAIVTEYLYTFNIPDEFNPARRCRRAPNTLSTQEAIIENLGMFEQEVIEAVEQGVQGFRDGWISSIMLNYLLKVKNLDKDYSQSTRRNLLKSLRYIPHPHLRGGRVNSVVSPDSGKPILFIYETHPSVYLTTAVEIQEAYMRAQQ